MSEADETSAADTGLALLLGGGVAEAMAGIEATLSTVQGAVGQVLAGLAHMQGFGAAAAAVPPVRRPEPAATVPAEAPAAPAQSVRSAERFARSPAPRPAGPQQMAAFAPVSTVAERAVAPRPEAGSSPESVSPAAPIASAAPVVPLVSRPGFAAAPVLLASFAPRAPAPAGPPSGVDARGAQVLQPAEPWSASAPERTQSAWVAPAAPMAAPESGGAAPRAFAPAASPPGQSGGPTGGDVFLDGTRVGTWIADHLAREAGRPQAGGTGFDPRLSPAWPGTLQGN